ncbi:MAG: type II toxin-antitoxin system RelE/ParE family toxin [Phycisphaerales bacterium]|nr:type II toxin-antitoxin system RelE/ParE family toxin [Hyphomonadaceae bacterium]
MKLRVVWGRRAATDVDAIVEFIAQDSKPAAKRVALYIRRSARLLQSSPWLGRATQSDETRELILSRYPYVLVYEIGAGEVRILAVFHQSQNRP